MSDRPWQLKLFDKSLKKKQKVKILRTYLNTLDGEKCLLITHGDNNGAMNYHIRNWGGTWTWAEFEDANLSSIEELLQEPVIRLDGSAGTLPFEDSTFDEVVVIDCHEHLHDPRLFNAELARVTRSGGKVVVSVPNGDESKLAVRIKRLVGMTEKEYGHLVVGYSIPQMNVMLGEAGLRPFSSCTYAKFFTEVLELCINFAYVKVLSRRRKGKIKEGTIAPTTKEQMRSVARSLKFYSLIYPFFLSISQLDALLFHASGYAVVVAARKE